jgi:hypothetical protein
MDTLFLSLSIKKIDPIISLHHASLEPTQEMPPQIVNGKRQYDSTKGKEKAELKSFKEMHISHLHAY